MPYEHRENSGSLFKNDRKEKENQPDYRGECNVYGQLFKISAWVKEGRNGKFMSISFTPKESADAPHNKWQQQQDYMDAAQPYKSHATKSGMIVPDDNELDDSIPF